MSQLEPSIIVHNDFKIQKSRPQPLLLECYPSLFGAASLITWITWLSYILTQIYLTRTILSGSLNSNWRIWAVLVSEFLLYFQELALAIHQISTLFSPAVNQIRPHYLLIGNHTPAIDIFITCCGESPDVVLDTLNASIGQDYPAENFRVFLLDDGHDFRLRQAVAQINSDRKANNGPRIFHLSRDVPVGTRSYFKAGNLQFGIEQSKALGGSEFIAALDADMIPERDWLRRIVPHLILDDEVGLGNPPQHYYNLPESDPLGQNVQLDLIFTIYEPLSDRVCSAMCSGSGYIVRRKALENIGGWPQVDVGEDASCSGVLRSHGWKVTFVREYLQLGLAPDSFQAYIRQKWRWADTALEVHRQSNFYFPGFSSTAGMTWVQRTIAILHVLREYSSITNVFALIALPLALYPTATDPFAAISSQSNLRWLYSFFTLYWTAQKLNNYLQYHHIGVRKVYSFQSNELWFAPPYAWRCFISLLPAPLRALKFDSAGSFSAATNERSRIRRSPLIYRLLNIHIILCFFYCIYSLTPLILLLTSHLPSAQNHNPIFVFPGVVAKLVDSIGKVSIPVLYMLFPPTVPERKDLLSVDGDGVRRPAKKRRAYAKGVVTPLVVDAVVFLFLLYGRGSVSPEKV